MLQQRYPNRFSQSPHMSHLEKNCFISASVSSDLKALYRVTKIKNEMKCSRRMKSVSRQCQFKQLQAAPEGKK